MFDLTLFYTDETQTTIADRPSDFKFSQAVDEISESVSNFPQAVDKHWETQMWRWFDVYRRWLMGDQKEPMYAQPDKQEIELRLNKHFRETFKANRQSQVDNITVTVDGHVFDGDETSRFRMATAVLAASSDTETINWSLADNTVASVTAAQLKEALRLSGLAMEAIWFQP